MTHDDTSCRRRLLKWLPVPVFGVWTVLFTWLLVGGKYQTFLQPSLWPLLAIGLVITLLFAAVAFLPAQSGHSHTHGQASWARAAILLMPIAYMLVSANASLGSHAFSKRSLGGIPLFASSAGRPQGAVEGEATIIEILSNPNGFIGKHVETAGAIYRAERLKPGSFLIFRFLIVCCAADAQPVALLVDAGDLAIPETDLWVLVSGTVEAVQVEDKQAPCIRADRIEVVDPPPPPNKRYLYPW